MTRTPSFVLLALSSLVTVAFAQSHFDKRLERFKKENAELEAGKRHVVLVGDSLTEAWESGERIQRFLPGIADHVLGRGIGGDGTRGLERRLAESIFDVNPSHIVLCLGVNDVGRDGSGVAGSAAKYETIVRAVRERLPDVPLVLVTLAPARGERFGVINPHVVAYNVHVRRIAQEAGCPLIDLHALVKDEQGELPATHATPDGLHWTDAVYEVLGGEIERVVGESAR